MFSCLDLSINACTKGCFLLEIFFIAPVQNLNINGSNGIICEGSLTIACDFVTTVSH